MTAALAEHFFRHEYGRLVATLSRRVGVHHIEAIEDAVQASLMAALETWTRGGTPDDPTAWLLRVAHNALLGGFRKDARRRRILQAKDVDGDVLSTQGPLLAGELQDDLLRMMFVCCDEVIPIDSQLVLVLKTLCGFDVREIALRLFTTEANVYKRLSRARQRLAEGGPDQLLDDLDDDQIASRLSSVQAVIHLVFTEGYLSSRASMSIRKDLCDEALRLATVLADHPIGHTPPTLALVALMHLHAARLDARQDEAGGLLLLEEQDRTRWDAERIEEGLRWLAASASGDVMSRYHAEAGIAAEHCMAPTFEQTRWDRVIACYDLLERAAPSSLHRLNRAVAVAESAGPEAALAALQGASPPTWLAGSYQWAAVLSDLHRRCGDLAEATRHREVALELAPTEAVRELLKRRLGGRPT